jgi:tetratricopeptide (TPR) repeat protein
MMYGTRFVVAMGLVGILSVAQAGPLEDAVALYSEAKDTFTQSVNPEAGFSQEEAAALQQEAIEKLRQARALFEEGNAGAASDPKIAYAYGEMLVSMRDFDLAAAPLKNAWQGDPANAAYALAYGGVLVNLGDRYAAEAVEALNAAIEADPNARAAAEAHAQLAELYQDLGLYSLTLAQADQAIAIDEHHAGARFMRAVCMARQGRFLEANNELDKVTAISPAVAGDSDGHLYDAVRDFERRKLWVANTAEQHEAYGKLLIRVNRMPDSIDALRHSVRLNPDNVVVWNLLGSAYRAVNRVDDAREAFEKSLELDTNQERTREVLQELAETPAT